MERNQSDFLLFYKMHIYLEHLNKTDFNSESDWFF